MTEVAGIPADTFDLPLLDDDELCRHGDAALNDVASGLAKLVQTAGEVTDPHTMLSWLYQLAELRRSLNAAYSELELMAKPLMGAKEIDVPGYGTFTAKFSKRRTGWRWRPKDDQPGLVDVVAASCADDWDGQPPAVFAAFVADELADCIGFSAGKVTGLKARSIDPAQFCVEDDAVFGIQLPAKVKDEDL